MFKTLAVFTFAAAVMAPGFAQSIPDASAERGFAPQWTGQKTRAQVHQEVLQARREGTLSYVGDQTVIKAPTLAGNASRTMGYGVPAPKAGSSAFVSHDGYRLVGDVYIYEGRR